MKKFLQVLSLAMVLAITLIGMVACGGPKDLESAKATMTEAGYSATIINASEGNEDGAIGTLSATKVSLDIGSGCNMEGEHVTATLFESSKAAKAYYEKHVDENEEDDDEFLHVKGKWVYFGTEAAIDLLF